MRNCGRKHVSAANFDMLSARADYGDKLFENSDSRIIEFIEMTRMKYGLSRTELSELLRIAPYTYSNWQRTRKVASTEVLLRFCYIFGYDIESLVASFSMDNDLATIELGVRIAALSDESLDKIKAVAPSLPELRSVRTGIAQVITAYQESRTRMVESFDNDVAKYPESDETLIGEKDEDEQDPESVDD